ncbi:UNC-like C-terminal-domain-containing protein [Protomyces lactucae-debilis]|uniref:UNC-like C-terminal-domain-containing protein n=1 Tax=Protomyces lactucae-debilis TaxID=2754530 RepID=A0A1Y2FR21_PROLT|nr:UNC-like C-terminal-domain-containing protein [Protomyces lactucae-debilis]ORY85764.1 UNC-like C-terminal-domain-containing protein [Protomyces lactucae-debilis]
MFTPAGAKSRAAARPARIRSRLSEGVPAALPVVGGPPSYSYGSPSARKPTQVGSRNNSDSIAGAFNAAIRESEYSVHLPSMDLDGDESAEQDTSHEYSRASASSKSIAVEDIEASINRRRSLRSSSRSIGRGSPSIISEQDFEDRTAEIDTTTHVSFDYELSQSSAEEDLDDDALLGQLGMAKKESQFNSGHVGVVLADEDMGDLQSQSMSSTSIYDRAMQHYTDLRTNAPMSIRRLRRNSDWRHFAILGCLLLLPLYFMLPELQLSPYRRNPLSISNSGIVPETPFEFGQRLVSLEAAVVQLQTEYARLADQGTQNRKDQAILLSSSSSLATGVGDTQTKLQQMSHDLKAIQARLLEDERRTGRTADTLQQLQAGVSSLEKKLSQQQQELANYIRSGAHLYKDVDSLKFNLEEQKKAVHFLNLQREGDSKKLHNELLKTFDSILPARLPVYLKPGGDLFIDPKFWTLLQAARTADINQTATFAETLLAHRDELKTFIKQSLQSFAEDNDGLIVSKPQFLSLLTDELKTFKTSLDTRMHQLAETVDTAHQLASDASSKSDRVISASSAQRNDSKSTSAEAIDYLVSEALLKHSIDVIDKPDYAAYNAGGRVNPFLTSPTYMHSPRALLQRVVSGVLPGVGSIRSHPPAVAIHPSTKVGMCWAFPGTQGSLAIKLSLPITLTDIVVEHVHPDIAHDASSAPRTIEIWAHLTDSADDIVSGSRVMKAAPASGFVHVMDIEYNVYHGTQAAQIFTVPPRLRQPGVFADQVLFRVNSNWGNPDYTCIYRVRAIGMPGKVNAAGSFRDDESL